MKLPYFLFSATTLMVLNTTAQTTIKTCEKGFELTILHDVEKTAVENQNMSSTCWSYSSNSFFESEMIRLGKEPIDLSEMFIVRQAYLAKADKYVRMHGNFQFAAGGAFHDVAYVGKNFGWMPESVYSGLLPNKELPYHNEMDHMLKAMLGVVVKAPNKELTPVWKNAVTNTIDAYLGQVPEKFEYKGKTYTPKTFVAATGLNLDDYVELGSYTHHPFYEKFIIEIPDNWMLSEIYNLPLEELMQTMRYAIEKGFSIAWGADVSEKGFSWKNGVAIVPENDWNKEEIKTADSLLQNPVANKTITQEYRQQEFDNYNTQDDHGMHITGLAKDKNNTLYYIVKNSWGESNEAKGFIYVSENYVALKTISIMVHKNAIPLTTKRRLGL